MRMLPRVARTLAFAAIVVGAGLLFGITGWLRPYRPVEFSCLIVAEILISALATAQPIAEDRGAMPPSFVIEFISLLLFGTGPTMLVAAAGALIRGRLASSQPFDSPRHVFLNTFTVIAAALAAGLAHRALRGT